MTIKGGSNKACAACKFQRRRCSKDCPLAPYFPANKPKTFSNAHRLFGVSNMLTILKQVQPDERDEAMKSIIFESDMRARYPVDGCYGVMVHYQHLISSALKELQHVQTLLAHFRQQNQQQQHHPLSLFPTDQCSILPTTSEVFPSYNHGEPCLFHGQVGCDCGLNIESKDNWMNNYPYNNDIMTNVGVKFNLLSMHEQSHQELNNIPLAGVTNANTNVMDAKSSEITSWAVQRHSVYDGVSFDEGDNDDQSLIECKKDPSRARNRDSLESNTM